MNPKTFKSLSLTIVGLIFLCTLVVVPPVLAVYPTTTATPTTLPKKTATPTSELVKTKVGAAKLSGAVSALGASSITVGSITVNVSPTTILLRKYGAKAKLSEFSVGDQVQVIGTWANTSQTIVNAKVIRNLSIQKRRGVFLGKVTSLTSTGFVLTPEKRPAQMVSVNLLTKYVDRGEKPITLSAIKVGDKVMAKGLWDSKQNTITEVTFVRDYSLPLKAPKTATPSATVK